LESNVLFADNVKAGIEKFREALEQDAKEAAARGSSLPKD